MRLALGTHAEAVERRVEALKAEDAAARIWQRDASFWGGDDARRRSVNNRLGWLDIASRMRSEAGALEAFAEEIRSAGFTDAVLLGMGGSSLAPEVLRRNVAAAEGYPRLHVLDTTDPAAIAAVTAAIDLRRTLFFVSSKSGTTIEPLSLFAYFHELVADATGDRAGDRFVAITDEGSPLQELAAEHGFRRVFTNPPDIGGRYSALSYFGLAPAAVCGVDVVQLVDAAVVAEREACAPDSDALQLGAALGQLARDGVDKCTFLVSPEVGAFGLWVEQLIAESTGKDGRGVLPVIDEPPGSPRRYGGDRVFVQLRVEAGSTGDIDALAGALAAEGKPVITLDIEEPHDLGAEFVRWEFAVAVAGRVLDVNPFDEPNVTESKDNTARVLREFENTGRLDIDGIDAARGIALVARGVDAAGGLDSAMAALLAAVPDRGYFAITAYLAETAESARALAGIRALVRDALGVATTLGYGPRFLHSTGQLHKGGSPAGAFLQVTVNDVPDIGIPGKACTFGQLKRAQAIGDFEALASHGRPVVRVHMNGDVPALLGELLEAFRRVTAAAGARR